MSNLCLQFGIAFEDLFHHKGLQKLQRAFETFLKKQSPEDHKAYLRCKTTTDSSVAASSDELILFASYLEAFIYELFTISSNEQSDKAMITQHEIMHQMKRKFVQRVVAKKANHGAVIAKTASDETATKEQTSEQHISKNTITENDVHDARLELANLAFAGDLEFCDSDLALSLDKWLQNLNLYSEHVKASEAYIQRVLLLGKQSCIYQHYHARSGFLDIPQKRDFQKLVPDGLEIVKRNRAGFSLTDSGFSKDKATLESHYCLICHNRSKDSCRTGLHQSSSNNDQGNQEDVYKKNKLGRSLTGCPLDQKISEMSLLKQAHKNIAALAVVMIDNPMVAVTGHRICNDCMMSCIFQNQDPVNIPGIESEIVMSVLNGQWGVEIYSLLMRWNPLRFSHILLEKPKPQSVLVVGQGPAGFSLAYFLLQNGFHVTGIDGLKIEPLDQNLIQKPVQWFDDMVRDLEDRVLSGFGGVAEYGITSRWNKNMLTLIRLCLERYTAFSLKGGLRFGSTITPHDAFHRYEFDHVALCVGAGAPNLIPIKNNLAKGIRQASDFLMNLQLTGAYKFNSFTGLDVHLPLVVIGGGLTAIDTATEALAYYQRQVEMFLSRMERHDIHLEDLDLPYEGLKKAKVWCEHAKALRGEKRKINQQKNDNAASGVQDLLRSWGGVKVLYRKDITKAPSYRLNHEEIGKALEEGIEIIPHATPLEFLVDEENAVTHIIYEKNESKITLPARSVFIAAGTKPNTTLSREFPDSFKTKGLYFDFDQKDSNKMSAYGDADAEYSGSVVKAIASAKSGAFKIAEHFQKSETTDHAFKPENRTQINKKAFDRDTTATVTDIKLISKDCLQLTIQAPACSRQFQSGQFFRLQPFLVDTNAYADGVAVTPFHVDPKQETLSFFIRMKGASTMLLQRLKKGQNVVLMGPTGQSLNNKISQSCKRDLSLHSVLLIGNGVNQGALMTYAQDLHNQDHNVTYLCHVETENDIFFRPFYETYVEPFTSDSQFCIGEKSLERQLNVYDLSRFQSVIVSGHSGFLESIKPFLWSQLKKQTDTPHETNASQETEVSACVLSPMQCMMKEICAQCLQKHVDPHSGYESYVYSCVNQQQNAKTLDISFLETRLSQNRITERLAGIVAQKTNQS